jgi:hypothetical protein
MNSLHLQKKWNLPSLALTIEAAGFNDVVCGSPDGWGLSI